MRLVMVIDSSESIKKRNFELFKPALKALVKKLLGSRVTRNSMLLKILESLLMMICQHQEHTLITVHIPKILDSS